MLKKTRTAGMRAPRPRALEISISAPRPPAPARKCAGFSTLIRVRQGKYESLIRHQEFRRELALPKESRPVPESIKKSISSASERYLDIINWKPVRLTEKHAESESGNYLCAFSVAFSLNALYILKMFKKKGVQNN